MATDAVIPWKTTGILPSVILRNNARKLGFVVNIHDALNLDIDLCLSPQECEKYTHVLSMDYTYSQLSKTFHGKTHRCRLKGIGIKKHLKNCNDTIDENTKNDHNRKLLRDSHIDLIRVIDQCNGWILVEVNGIDVYGRFLVTLYNPLTGENLNNKLLTMQYNNIYYHYVK